MSPPHHALLLMQHLTPYNSLSQQKSLFSHPTTSASTHSITPSSHFSAYPHVIFAFHGANNYSSVWFCVFGSLSKPPSLIAINLDFHYFFHLQSLFHFHSHCTRNINISSPIWTVKSGTPGYYQNEIEVFHCSVQEVVRKRKPNHRVPTATTWQFTNCLIKIKKGSHHLEASTTSLLTQETVLAAS